MPAFSAFASTHFTSKPPYQQQIYQEMVKSLGSGKNYSDDFDSLVGARLYAWAMALGRCKYEIERLGHQWDPYRALEGLPVLERELGVIPEPGSTIAQRRAEVVVASRIARGASRPNVEAIMSELFGADFVEYFTVATADVVTSPVTATTAGVYDKPGSPRAVLRLIDFVATLHTPIQIRVELVAGNIETLRAGRRLVLDTGNYARVEAVTMTAVAIVNSTTRLVTATFNRPHERGTIAATGRHANQYTSKRLNTFQLKPVAAANARIRRRLNRAANRLLRGVSTWCIADNSGPFRVGEGMLGITPIGGLPAGGSGDVFDFTFDATFG